MSTYTIHDLTTEMQSFLKVSDKLLEKAKKSKVTTKNSAAFNKLIRQWSNGLFDEDPGMVLQWIEEIINKEG